MGRWLTPNETPTGYTCRRLIVPDGVDWLAILNGALLELSREYNFEPYGAVTPDAVAATFSTMWDRFSIDKDVCRMVGEVILWAGSYSPASSALLLCDGSLVSSDDYLDLWNVIGLTYGGTDAGAFALPDLRGRVPVGVSTVFPLGDAGGEIDHTLTASEMPAHTHSEITASATIINGGLEAPAASAIPGIGTTGSAGSGDAHNNMQPYLALRYYIVAA